jgi:hypothetical protein
MTDGVASLALFRSAATADRNPATTDFDFLVTVRADVAGHLADRFLGLAEDLDQLLGRPVDLLTPDAIRNPYLRGSIEATRVHIYSI